MDNVFEITENIQRQKTCVITEDTGIEVGDVITHQDPITQETHSIRVVGVARRPNMGVPKGQCILSLVLIAEWKTVKVNPNMIYCTNCKGTWWNKKFRELFKYFPECGARIEQCEKFK